MKELKWKKEGKIEGEEEGRKEGRKEGGILAWIGMLQGEIKTVGKSAFKEKEI